MTASAIGSKRSRKPATASFRWAILSPRMEPELSSTMAISILTGEFVALEEGFIELAVRRAHEADEAFGDVCQQVVADGLIVIEQVGLGQPGCRIKNAVGMG